MSSITLIRRFLRECDGGVALMAGIGLVPLFAALGVAVDFSRAATARTAMQAALDASVLAIAKDARNLDAAYLNQSATQYFNANFQNANVGNLQTQVAASSASNGYSVAMSVTGSLHAKFMRVVGVSSMDVSVRSVAMSHADGLGCVLSLNPHASGAISGSGTSSVTLRGCSLYDNSDSETALTVGNSVQLAALSVGVVGNLTGASNITTEQGIKTKIGAVADPYKDDTYPSFGGCTAQNFHSHATVTIDPGVYCGGMKINAGATVTLNPGIYYLDGGSLFINGGATLTGNGVTLVFTSQNRSGFATATVNGGANVNLTPPRFGPTAGIVMFGDRRMAVGTSFKFNGGATQYFGGAIYIPAGELSFAGGLETAASCTQLIADTIKFTGSSKLALNCSNYGTKPFSPLVVRLQS